MPYATPERLPDYVKKLDAAKQRQWLEAFNSAESLGASPFGVANAAVKGLAGKSWDEDCWFGDDVEPLAKYYSKATQASVNYNPVGGSGEKACANCQWFQSPNGCVVVEDYPIAISPTGLSDMWRAIEVYEPTPMPVVIVEKASGVKGLWQALVKTAKEWVDPSDIKPPVIKQNSFSIFKDVNGDYRWVAVTSNKYRDHDYPPEIIEDSAHKEYVAWLDAGGEYPDAWLWHTPGTKWGKADWADYADGFLVFSGTVDKGSESVAEKLAEEANLGISHGFNLRYSNAEKGIIGWYRTFEVSPLPMESAANPWTGLSVIRKEAEKMFSESKKVWLAKVLGADKVNALEGDIQGIAKALEDAGVEYKDMPTESTDNDSKDQQATPDAQPTLTAKDITDAVIKAVEDSPRLKALDDGVAAIKANSDQVPFILERLQALEKSDDDKLVDLIKARATPGQAQGYRASVSDKTLVQDEDTLSKAGPSWITKSMSPIV